MSDIAMVAITFFLFGVVAGVAICAFVAFAQPIPDGPESKLEPEDDEDHFIDLKI